MRRGLVVAGLIGGLLGGLLLGRRPAPPEVEGPPAAPPGAPEASPGAAPDAPRRAVIRRAARKKSASHNINSASRSSREAAAAPPLTPDADPEPDTGALDTPEPYDLPPGASVPDALRASIEEVKPVVTACINDWVAAEGPMNGRVVLEFDLGASGLGEAAVADREGLPPLVESCFASALYEARWPRLAEPTVVRYPFVVETDEDDAVAP